MNEICRYVSNTHILKQNRRKIHRLPTFKDDLRPKNDQKMAQIDQKRCIYPPGALRFNQMAVFMNEFRKDLSNSHFLKQNRRKICRLLPFKDDLRSKYALFLKKMIIWPPLGQL